LTITSRRRCYRGAAGIGCEIGQRLAAGSCRMIVVDVVPERANSADGTSSVAWRKLDVTDHRAVHAVFDGIMDEFGPVHVFVNNAGIQRHRAIEGLSWQEWSAVMDVNVHGVFNCLPAASGHRHDPETDPSQEVGCASESAAAARFLLSDQATYMNGRTLHVDVGFMAHYGIPLAKKPKP